MKLTITMNDDLVKQMDQYAQDNFMSRSGAISSACNQMLLQSSVSKALQDLAVAMRKIADTGEIDDETKKTLVDVEAIARMLALNN